MGLTLRSRLSLILLTLILISILLVSLFALDAFRRMSSDAQAKSYQALLHQAEGELANFNALAAQENNRFFADFSNQALLIADYIAVAYRQPQQGPLSAAELGLRRLPGDQYANSAQALTSVFIPNFQPLSSESAKDVNTTAVLEQVFPGVYNRLPGLVAIYFTTPNEVTRYYPNNNAGEVWPPDYRVTSQTWYAQAIANEAGGSPVWTAPYQNPNGDGVLSTLAVPVYDQAGNLSGVIGMDVNLQKVVLAVQSYDLNERGYSFLIDAQGRGIVLPGQGYQDLFNRSEQAGDLGADFTQATLSFQGIIQRMMDAQAGLESIQLKDRQLLVAFSPLPSTGWSLGSVMDTSLVVEPVQPLHGELETDFRNLILFRMLPVLVILAVIVLELVVLLVDRWLKPLGYLVAAAEKIGSGNYDVEFPAISRDEIGVVSGAFRTMKEAIRSSVSTLEERVIQRTHQLERRTMQLQAAADIARDIAQNRDLNALLVQTVAQIHDRFGFYHAGIFLIDATDGMLVLRAANSREGAQMLSQGYRLSVDESTLIGDVAKMGRSRLASDTTTTPILFMSPLLPETRSEVALPLAVLGDKGEKVIIGVLDVHSVEPDAFDEQEVTALQILADQLAAAVANVRLFNEYQQNLHELGKVYNRFRQDAWTLYIRNQQLAGYELTSAGLFPIYRETKGSQQLSTTESGTDTEKVTYSLPIRLRDETVATLEVWPAGDSMSAAELHLLEVFAERLSMALESARLYEEAQNRAAREQQINKIANQIRGSANLDAILRNAVRELGLAFKASRTFIQLNPASKERETESIIVNETSVTDGTDENGNPT